jgi:hypothetical protein
MKKRIGVVLSGCGVYDGSEIHEAVFTLLAIDRAGAEAVCMAPDRDLDEVNHLTGQPTGARRNVLVESARICLNAVYGVPFRVTGAERFLTGKTIDAETAAQAAEAGMQGVLPLLNNRYKAQIARTLVKRAILACDTEA